MATPFTAFSLSFADEAAFLDHWANRYTYPDAERYDPHIGRPLTRRRLWDLFYWKNGGPISEGKQASIRRNYPVPPPTNPEGIYLDPHRAGGAIWNIFYLHCIDPQRWPIYDQHAHRAMVWIQDRCIDELPTNQTRASKQRIYELYQRRFIPFLDEHFAEHDRRRIDRALFTYGRFLKQLKPYC